MQGHGDEGRLRRAGGKKKGLSGNGDWIGWRGPRRDGTLDWLPAKLPAKPRIAWRQALPSKGLGGVAATDRFVVVSARELMDSTDLYLCLDAKTGKEAWRVLNPAAGELDYGNSPRGTPLIHDGRVYLAGAFGHLHCVDLKTGTTLWEMDAREDFKAADKRKWGCCTSPLIAGGKLIHNPGGKDASLVALDPKTGKVVWKTPGAPASYGNFIAATLGGKEQVVGFDAESLGGWDLATGKRLWTVKAERR
ncbi:MAG: PQQ-like beta-propeller repeat protein, partial [Gemmataceae bacterium]|nr:PQQ-like beta-propeller repeat protein [Gemmataceae bacterium]